MSVAKLSIVVATADADDACCFVSPKSTLPADGDVMAVALVAVPAAGFAVAEVPDAAVRVAIAEALFVVSNDSNDFNIVLLLLFA